MSVQQQPASSELSSCLPTPGVVYTIEHASLLTLLQIKPRIPDGIITSGSFLAWKVESSDEDFLRIQRYFENSKNPHNVKIKNILRLLRASDMEPHALDEGTKMMLFHGTKEENIGDILNLGLSPSDLEQGGIVFTDRVGKSVVDYCKLNASDPKQGGGWVFLCEVLLGKTSTTTTITASLPTGFNSLKRVGQNVPDETGNVTEDDCLWPVGRTVWNTNGRNATFLQNEYIVFSKRQARLRYLIEYEGVPSPVPSPVVYQAPVVPLPPAPAVVPQGQPQAQALAFPADINDEWSYLPTPGVDYKISNASLLTLLQIRPRIPDAILTSGTFLTWLAGPEDEDYKRIELYFENSKMPNKVRIKNILRIVRVSDVDPHVLEQGPKMMLFHGTSEANIGEILNTGFLPQMSRYNGGIFFADRVAKSLQYCRVTNAARGGGWLFICEVLLGTKFNSTDWAVTLPEGFNSIKRTGQNVPDEGDNETEDGVVWPVGKTVRNTGGAQTTFPYNEYIVFCKRQARPRYLIEYETIIFSR